MITVSLCMIVKNEEKILSRCLNSYLGLFDEIIIVDTGSTDNTKNIAKKYTDKIYDYKWINDFADARNYAFSLCSCQYIFCADADEVLDKTNRLAFSQLKEVLLPEIDIVQMKYVNTDNINQYYNCKKELRPKLFKRLRTFTWISPIHETVLLEPVIYDSDIEILHMPETLHTKRDFSIFATILERGETLKKYVVLMFCKEMYITATNDDLVQYKPLFLQYMTAYTDKDCMLAVNCVLAKMCRITNDTNNFFKYALKNIACEACSEICMEIGEYYFEACDYEEAILWFINAEGETSSILDIHSGNDAPLNRLADCYSNLSEIMTKQYTLTGNDEYQNLATIYHNNSTQYRIQAQNWKMPEEL